MWIGTSADDAVLLYLQWGRIDFDFYIFGMQGNVLSNSDVVNYLKVFASPPKMQSWSLFQFVRPRAEFPMWQQQTSNLFFCMFLRHFDFSYLYFWFNLFHLSVCFMDMLKTHYNDFQFWKHFDEFSGQFKFTIFRSLNSQFQRQILWWVSSLKRAFQKVT